MRLVKIYEFKSKEIKGIRLGWSLVGSPLMTTVCYVLKDLMIDTGTCRMQRELISLAAEHGVKRAFLTHHHEDHSGNAAALKKKLGVQVYGHPLAVDKMSRPDHIRFYQLYFWGKARTLKMESYPKSIDTKMGLMKAIHTPGHAKDHTCYYIKDAGVLFSGDIYLADRIRYFRKDECVGTQIESLKTLLKLDFNMLLCGHYPRVTMGRERIKAKLAFMEDLYGSVITLWKKGLTEKEIFKTMKLKEDQLILRITFGNVSMLNGVRSVIRHYTDRQGGCE
jgi:glyoxylase-like metal-dependent hydrolase (beta-lactamase superfamily II)